MVVQDSPDTRMTDLIPKGGGKNTSLGLPVDRKHRLKHRFEVVKKLGQGTYGKVQLAVNKETGQEVAIKTIKKSKIESDQDLVRIRREIQIMSSVQHPHIIHIYEVFENKEKIVLVMQYASGGELYDYLSEKKILNDNEARRIFRQIAAAIYYCHKNKICHRDLKLENVLLDERGNAKIADFGLSNVFDDRHLLATYCGSPLYASPEIVKGTPYYGPEVDCWSMGVLLYTLVYGAMPFDGSNFKRLVKQISEGDYYEPKKKSEATGLIRRLLTVNPAKRASIIDICSDWWVNTGYEHSLLQVAEDTANLTPVRLDLLVALAPVSPPPVGGNKFKPSFNTPTVAEAANVSSGVEDSCEEAAGSHEENGEMSSSSFAYVSGGMASEMNVSTENPDDIFHQEHDASDEEFLSADLAAALEGQCIKRPAEKSFDGSMARVSSIAHKSKKPRKSDSLAASKKSLLRVSAPSPDTASSSGQRTDDENEQLVQITKTDTLTAVDQVMAEVDHEKTPEADTVKKTQPTEEATDKPKEEDEQQPKTEETETAKKEPVKKKIVKKTTPESGDGTKKVKRKIISSSAKKAAEKIVEGRADSPPKRSESPSKTRAESPLKVNQRAESPAKSKSPVKGNKSPSPCKVDTKTKTSESPSRTTKSSESPSRTGKTSESPSRATKTSDSPSRATKTSDSPSRTTKTSESPSRTINKSSESPPKVTVAKDGESSDKKEPKKSGSTPGRILLRKRSEASPEKKPLETKPAAIGAARKPGKLVIPRFLESTITTPSPKVVAETPKKLVIPIRSVSDAKKAFEVKTKPTPVNLATPKKTTEKDENSTIKSEIEVQDDKEKTTTTAEETKDTVVAKVNDDKETKTKDTKLEDVPSAMETEKTEKTLEKKEEVTSVKDENKTTTDKPVEESDEEKKVAAKSILKKTLARARLAERKLSQQSSMDSETGSQCVTPPASLVTTPTSQVNATSYFKIPKPYSKENVASNVESKAEITLGKKINKEEKKNNKEETIWGSPMSPSSSSNSKLKRSVLSSSIESDMNNWRTEVEESLKRLSPEGAAEENHSYTSQTSQDSDGGTGPAPITRSYKKFTFTKDGSTITETGEVYTEPKPDGTWTKVEKKTKVTTNQTPVATERKFDKTFKETSPLRHSDSQSSSGSNDVFDDIFDSWTGDSVFGNLLKMDSAFSRFAKDSLRRDRRRESLRRPKSDRTTTRPSRDWTRAEKLAAGHSTDRESSDNEDDFDFHFDGSHPVSYGSQGLMNFMKAMHLNFNDHLRSFKDRHRQGSFSRSLSRDRDDASRPRDLRGRSDSKSGLSGYSAMNRSTSRDRTSSSPRESVLRFVVDHPRRQDSTRSEPRTYHHQRMNSWGSRERLGRDGFDDNVRESGVGSSWDGYASDHGAKFSSPIDSPEVNTDRTSLFGSGRPKGFQRYRESLSKEGGESPSTPQSTKSGPELLDRSRPEGLSDNRRRRVEHWLETNPEDLVDPDNAYAWTTRSLLRDMPEFSSLYEGLPRPKSGFMRYSRSSSDKLADFDERPNFQESGPTSRDRVSNRSPMFRTISEVQVSGNPRNAPQDPSLRDQYDFGSAGTLNDPPVAEKPPKMTRATSQGSATFTRSSSGNPTHVEIVSNPDGSLEMETPVNSSAGSGSRTPVLRMRVSFNGSSESPRVQTTRESPVWQGGAATESTGLWNQERPVSPLWSSDFQDGSSLLEALKNRGYRNVISQRLHHNQYSGSSLLAEDGDREAERVTAERGGTVPSEAGPRAGEAQPNPPSGSRGAKEADAAGGSSTPKRGKACNSASSTPAETERDACCMMETNPPPERNVAATTTIVDDDCNDELDRSENSEEYIVEKISSKITETPDIIAPVVTKLNGHNNHHGYAHHGHSRAKVNGEKNNHHHDEAASDGTLTPDSLDSSKERAARRASKSGYEEESVSERILRKSFYSRFNDDRPKRRSFVYQDNNLDFSLQDLRGSGGLWSRFSDPKTDSTIADDPYSSPMIRRANRRTSNTATPEKRSSANLEESSWLRKSESNSSYDYASDDGLWASKPPLPSRRSSPKSTNGSSSSVGKTGGSGTASEWYDKPTGSLWSARKDSHSGSRSYREPSVIDIVPDLSESRRSSRSSFSFYSPTVTPRSPVFSSRSLVQDGIVTSTTDAQHEDPGSGERTEPKTRRRSLVEPQFVVHEEIRSRQSSGSSSVSVAKPNLVQNGSSDVIKSSNDANSITDFDLTLAATNNINMIKPKEAILSNE